MIDLNEFKNIVDTNLHKLDITEESKKALIGEVKKKSSPRLLKFIIIPTAAAVIAFAVTFSGDFSRNQTAEVQAADLMKGIKSQKVEKVPLSKAFINSTADFSIDLFKKSYTKNKNSLISPTSVYLALGMTANGADGKTLKEFETLLGGSNLTIKDLNAFYNTFSSKLTKVSGTKVSIANSIWYRNTPELPIDKDFLQTNADYYNASAYEEDFNSNQTIKKINNWVNANTDNQIDKIIDKIDPNTEMYLINATCFDAKWEKPYQKNDVQKGTFTLENGAKKTVDFMHSLETGYVSDSKAQGFVKPYADGKYSFVALLPNQGVSLDSYVASLSGESFINLLNNKSEQSVNAALPKFKSEYSVELQAPLEQMGLSECFSANNADFSKMLSTGKPSLFISNVLHKTSITVDTQGTKAGAATEVQMEVGMTRYQHVINITLNRPFAYAIIDNETKLPLFIGTMTDPIS